jgi:hypothetical protein
MTNERANELLRRWLQKGAQFLGQLSPEARDLGDFGGGRGAEFLDAAKMYEEGGAAFFAEAGKIIEHALADFFRAKVRIVSVGEAVRFVAETLEDVQAGMVQR